MTFPGICVRNYTLLLRPAERGDLALMECTDRQTGAHIYVICDVWREGSIQGVTPLAQLQDGNSSVIICPPGIGPMIN